MNHSILSLPMRFIARLSAAVAVGILASIAGAATSAHAATPQTAQCSSWLSWLNAVAGPGAGPTSQGSSPERTRMLLQRALGLEAGFQGSPTARLIGRPIIQWSSEDFATARATAMRCVQEYRARQPGGASPELAGQVVQSFEEAFRAAAPQIAAWRTLHAELPNLPPGPGGIEHAYRLRLTAVDPPLLPNEMIVALDNTLRVGFERLAPRGSRTWTWASDIGGGVAIPSCLILARWAVNQPVPRIADGPPAAAVASLWDQGDFGLFSTRPLLETFARLPESLTSEDLQRVARATRECGASEALNPQVRARLVEVAAFLARVAEDWPNVEQARRLLLEAQDQPSRAAPSAEALDGLRALLAQIEQNTYLPPGARQSFVAVARPRLTELTRVVETRQAVAELRRLELALSPESIMGFRIQGGFATSPCALSIEAGGIIRFLRQRPAGDGDLQQAISSSSANVRIVQPNERAIGGCSFVVGSYDAMRILLNSMQSALGRSQASPVQMVAFSSRLPQSIAADMWNDVDASRRPARNLFERQCTALVVKDTTGLFRERRAQQHCACLARELEKRLARQTTGNFNRVLYVLYQEVHSNRERNNNQNQSGSLMEELIGGLIGEFMLMRLLGENGVENPAEFFPIMRRSEQEALETCA